MKLNEFDLIKKFFANKIASRPDVILGIGDDCAILEVPPNQQLVITIDTLVAGVHFPENTSAYDIGYKSIAVNLSDLAAMGASPAWITLALTLPSADPVWLENFSRGLFTLSNRYGVELIGGDTTRGPLSITIEAHGLIPKNQAIKRSGAKVGDLICVTNTLGDAAAGLSILQKNLSIEKEQQAYFLTRINRPEPRIETGLMLRDIATSAIDISDGLIADLGHILEKSNVGALIHIEDLPLSEELRNCVTPEQAISFALAGGDDYELCFTVPKEKRPSIKNQFTCIGTITENTGINIQYKDGTRYDRISHGFQHF